VQRLSSAPVRAEGPLSAASLLVALLAAEGEGLMEEAHWLWHRYQDPLSKLKALGAGIELRAT